MLRLLKIALVGFVVIMLVAMCAQHTTHNSAPVTPQYVVGPAMTGDATLIAQSAIKDAGHPCPKVTSAVRSQDGSIRAVCSNGKDYRVFSVNGLVVAMSCTAARKIGVEGC